MRILITNDDGYRAKGIRVLTEIMRKFGDVTVVAPKTHQSGMSMAVSLGFKAIRYKKVREEEAVYGADGSLVKGSLTECYIDATPASCVKYALNIPFVDNYPDVVVSGINHGSNAASAACYSGTLGAAEEGTLNGVPSIGVSLDTMDPDADFSAVEKYFPDIFRKIMANLPERREIYYNVNFPAIPVGEILGIRTGHQGKGRWIKEYVDWDLDQYTRLGLTPEMFGESSSPAVEEGEKLYLMVGTFIDDPENDSRSDHHIMMDKYISIVAHNVDCTDYTEVERLHSLGFDTEF